MPEPESIAAPPREEAAASRLEGSAYSRVLREEQLKNALSFHWYRLVGVSGFLALEMSQSGVRWMDQGSPSTFAILFVYWVAMVLVQLASWRWPSLGLMGSLAVPFLDMPVIFFCQWHNLVTTTADPRVVGNFSIAIFVCLIMLAASSLERWQIYLAGIVGGIFQFTLHRIAGEGTFGTVGGLVLIGVAAAMCDFARRNRVAAIYALCQEQLRRERLGRYFSPQVAIEIEKGRSGLSDGQWCEVTVLFSDLRDFTTLSERLETQEIVKLLNQYFEHMVQIVFEHGGTLDKYIGDGLMAYFGAPLTTPHHAERAVKCALAMKHSLAEINARRHAQGEPELRMGVGLHTGMAVIGSIGAAHRREYTAIGDTVNLAARIEQLTKQFHQDILLSSETQERAGMDIKFKEITECAVKGRVATVKVFAPG